MHAINGFSAHADQAELLAWRERSRPEITYVVHGAPEAMASFATRLEDTRIEMPKLHQEFDL